MSNERGELGADLCVNVGEGEQVELEAVGEDEGAPVDEGGQVLEQLVVEGLVVILALGEVVAGVLGLLLAAPLQVGARALVVQQLVAPLEHELGGHLEQLQQGGERREHLVVHEVQVGRVDVVEDGGVEADVVEGGVRPAFRGRFAHI